MNKNVKYTSKLLLATKLYGKLKSVYCCAYYNRNESKTCCCTFENDGSTSNNDFELAMLPDKLKGNDSGITLLSDSN